MNGTFGYFYLALSEPNSMLAANSQAQVGPKE